MQWFWPDLDLVINTPSLTAETDLKMTAESSCDVFPSNME